MTRLLRTDASAPFFDAALDNRLVLPRCGSCATWRTPLDRRCAVDGEPLAWAEAGRRGTLVSWAVEHYHDTPRAVALVELDEGPWLPVLVLGDPGELRIGEGVEIGFAPVGDGELLPVLASGDGPGTS